MYRLINNLNTLMFQKEGRIKSFSFENPNAIKGNAAKTASVLGPSRKGTPFICGFQAGETAVLADVDGPGIVRRFYITVTDLPNGGSLEKLILRMYWDHEEVPSVECPLGAFFQCGDGEIHEMSSIPISVIPARSFHCYFQMPFKKHARITIENQYNQEISVVAYQVTCTVDLPLPEDIRYFHVGTEGSVLTGEDTDRCEPQRLELYDAKSSCEETEKNVKYWYSEKASKEETELMKG